jgi:hypothetical protein
VSNYTSTDSFQILKGKKMTRKVTHEIKLPKSLTAAIYVIAITNIFIALIVL